MMAGRNRPLDAGRAAALLRRPGIDTRIWICEAVITELGFDPAEGVFADIRILPEDTPETARVGIPYAGNGFGAWFPLEIDDIVLVAIPMGDSNSGPVIIARIWNASDRPPSDCAGAQVEGGTAPTEDAVIRIKPGHALKLRTSGTGPVSIIAEGSGDVTVQQAGTGNVIIKVESAHKVLIGDETATEPIALGQVLSTWMSSLKLWLNTHVHTVPAGPGTSTPPTVALGDPPDVRAQKGYVK